MNLSVSNLIGVIRGVIERFFSEGIRDDHDLEDRLRIRVINIISVITILVLTFFGTVALGKGQLTLGFSDLSVALIFFITQIYLRTTGNYSLVKYFWVGSTGVLFVYLFNTGGVENTGHLWAYIFPLVAAFLLGARKGAIAISAVDGRHPRVMDRMIFPRGKPFIRSD